MSTLVSDYVRVEEKNDVQVLSQNEEARSVVMEGKRT